MTEPAQSAPQMEPIKVTHRTSPLKRFFLRGLVLLLPTIITVWVLVKVVGFLHHNVVSYVADLVVWIFRRTDWFLPETSVYLSLAIAWLLCLGLVALTGMVFGGFVGHRIWVSVENALMRLPAIRFVYPYVKQVIDFVFTKPTLGFKQVVAVEYPRKGVYSLGFVTGRAFEEIERKLNAESLSVFIPSSPTPMTGYVVFLPREDVIFLPLTIEEALRMTISGGVVRPGMLESATDSGAQSPVEVPDSRET